MKQDIDGVIARRIGSPAPPFQPKNRIGQRVIFRQAFAQPDVLKSAGGLEQRIIRHHVPVIPNKSAAHGRAIHQHRDRRQKCGRAQHLFAIHGMKPLDGPILPHLPRPAQAWGNAQRRLYSLVVVSALCAEVEPQARRYNKLRLHRCFVSLDGSMEVAYDVIRRSKASCMFGAGVQKNAGAL